MIIKKEKELMEKIVMNAFCVIGKVGSSEQGEGFVQKLWQDANGHFNEVADLAKKDENGELVGIWGAMTDFSFAYQPWEDNFTKGLYCAGVEARDDAIAPKGWKKWIMPGFECLKVPNEGPDTLWKTLEQMKAENMELVAAIQDYTDPKTQISYMLFPIAWNDSKQKLIRKMKDETDQVAVCGFHCEHCPYSEWCGGCNSACNMCSFATCSEDNMCENLKCAISKGYKKCAECAELLTCKKGFFSTETGDQPKIGSLFIRKYGVEKYAEMMNKLEKHMDEYNEELKKTTTVEEGLALVEKYM